MAIASISKISSVTPTNAVSNTTTASKTLENQLLLKQQTLNKLSNNSSIDAEEKEKQRQELQKEIEELKRKLELLRQRQTEAQKANSEKMEKEQSVKKTSTTNLEEKEHDSKKTTMPSDEPSKAESIELTPQDIHQILDRNFELKKEMIQQGVAYDKENHVRQLTAEIKQDELYGIDTSNKEAQLEKLQKQEIPWKEATKAPQSQDNHVLIHPDAQVIIE